MTTSQQQPAPTPVLHAPHSVWSPGDFQVVGPATDGTAKLSSSAVAPLVAAARGYEIVESEDANPYLRRVFDRVNSKPARSVKAMFNGASLMEIPHFSADSVDRSWRAGIDIAPSARQYKPASPQTNSDGKPIKYQFPPDSRTVIDVHPSTPLSWLDDAPIILFTEGVIKGDSALTGVLREAGVSDDVLSGGEDVDPRAALHEVMEEVPADKRVLVFSIAGVHNWKNNSEWSAIDLRGRDGAWVAFDGDMATNWQVWQAAYQFETFLTKSKKVPAENFRFVDLSGIDHPGGKAGVDDFLAEHGVFRDLAGLLTDQLPPRPSKPIEELIGEVRIGDEDTKLQECVPIRDPQMNQNVTGAYWSTLLDIGGRVKKVETYRMPSEREKDTFELDQRVDANEQASLVTVEVAFREWGVDDGPVERYDITGPDTILESPPTEWSQKFDAIIPLEVKEHPSWPPRGKTAESWLKAIKSHRVDDKVRTNLWSKMGWVPTENGHPAFIIGDQIIGANGPRHDIASGVGEKELPGASSFGVKATPVDPDETEWKAQAKADIEKVLDVYLDGGVWKDKRIGALMLAIALRPAIPLRPKAPIVLVGAPGSGKSWTASTIMSFWQQIPGTWTEDRLPGSAKDSESASERANSIAPIWIMDDMAPAADKQSTERIVRTVEGQIRAVHNGTGRRLSHREGSARLTMNPQSVLVVTAENDLSNASAAGRALTVRFPIRSLRNEPMNTMMEMRDLTGESARMMGAFVRYIATERYVYPHQQSALAGIGETTQGYWEQERAEMVEAVSAMLANTEAEHASVKRQVKLLADYLITFDAFAGFCKYVGVDKKIVRKFARAFYDETWATPYAHTISLAVDSHNATRESSPGRNMVEALRSILASGKGHILNCDSPAQPPVVDADGGEDVDIPEYANVQLGWRYDGQNGDAKAGSGSEMIGKMVVKDGKHIVVFDEQSAFAAAKSVHNLIPHAATKRSLWQSVWDEGFAVENDHGIGARRKANKKSPSDDEEGEGTAALYNTVRIRSAKGVRPSGIPILLDTILSLGQDDDE